MDQDQNGGGEVSQDIPQKVVINGQEYDPTEASELIGKGRLAREYESKWNSPIDSLATAYGKSQSELTAAREQLAKFNEKKDAGTETNLDVQKAQEAARKLGIVLNDDLGKAGYIKREDLDKYYDERQSQQKAIDKVMSKADDLEKTINGEDGRPKFSKRVVLAYANTYGFSDLEKAYEDMHKDSLDSWKSAQVENARKPGLKTLSGSKKTGQPKDVKVTNDNFAELMAQAIGE